MVAGETSGDLLGARLISAITKQQKNVEFSSICGPRMVALGAESMFPMEDISVMGLDDLATRLLKIIRVRKRIAEHFIQNPPDVFVGIDVPDFNLGLETRLREKGIPTVHYVSPTVWAWRGYRIRKIRRAVDHMLTLFPFEAEYYRRHSVPVTYVGHPIADEVSPEVDKNAMRARFKVTADQLVALLPGSRRSELKRLGGLFLSVAESLVHQHRDVEFIAPFANQTTKDYFSSLLQKRKEKLPIQLHLGSSRDALASCDVALLASGTAALEAALLAKPMVVTYKVSWLTGLLVKMFAHVRYFSMPNNLLGTPVVPELLQSRATVVNLTRAVAEFLDNPTMRNETTQRLAQIHHLLKCDASERAAGVILKLVAS